MPQATEDQRREWWPDDDPTGSETAVKFLRAAGYRLHSDWTWSMPPPFRDPTPKETSAARYLIDEWDFGGFRRPPG